MKTPRDMSETKGSTQHLGYWRQDKAGTQSNPDAPADLPWPGDFIDKSWDPVELEMVARYLDAAPDVQHYFGESWCRLGCEDEDDKLRMGCSDKSDGTYTWPEGLSHYVRVHKVKPPQAFIDHAVRNQSEGVEWAMTTVVTRIDWSDLKATFDHALKDALAKNPGWPPVLSQNIEIEFFLDAARKWGDDHLLEIKAIDVFGMWQRLEIFERALNLQATNLYRQKTGKGPPLHYMRELEASGLGRPTLAQIRFKVFTRSLLA